jgi:hypothetical protein
MEKGNRSGWSFEGRFHMNNVRVRTNRSGRISQGDIFRDVECIEYVAEKSGVLEVSKLVFPLVVVLTQDCDLEQDARYRDPQEKKSSTDDKKLFSVLVAPLYNAEHVFQGQHLSDLGLTMASINKKKTPGVMLMQNERPRYHYLDFPADVHIVPSVADFKHYFSVSVAYLEKVGKNNFVCRLSELYREDLSQRFASYLARIGLPEIVSPTPTALPTGAQVPLLHRQGEEATEASM